MQDLPCTKYLHALTGNCENKLFGDGVFEGSIEDSDMIIWADPTLNVDSPGESELVGTLRQKERYIVTTGTVFRLMCPKAKAILESLEAVGGSPSCTQKEKLVLMTFPSLGI